MKLGRILVLCTRRIGDVLLTTPLIRSIRRAYPDAELDVLTLTGSAAVLEGNPDINRVITIPERASLKVSLQALGPPRSYDLAVSTLYNDRPHLMALWAAPLRVNVVPPTGHTGARWKRWLSTEHVPLEDGVHTVEQYLRLADKLDVSRFLELVAPSAKTPPAAEITEALGDNYLAIHPVPLYSYKDWTIAGWQSVIQWARTQGLRVMVSGGHAAEQRQYINEVLKGTSTNEVIDVAGRLTLAQLAGLLARARAYVGPDTSITHLAAATGVPSVALFGPSSPSVWGPWPAGGQPILTGTPWQEASPLQNRGNVWLLQGLGHCVPCLLEGCRRTIASRSQCLDLIPPARVIESLRVALHMRTVGSGYRSAPRM